MRRVALKIAYIGTKFHGYQRQPEYRTVEGDLLKVFMELGIIKDLWKAHYSVAGRTDKGVHALCNVISFITEEEIYINQINGMLPDDIKIMGEARVHYGFKVRFPQTRTYKYIQPINPFEKELDISAMQQAMSYFKGKHNFRNFSKRNEKNPNRNITNVNLEQIDNTLCFTIEGESFLWNMVRKMVRSLLNVGTGELKPEAIQYLLQKKELRQQIRLKPVPANGLILTDLNYNKIKFKDSTYAKHKLINTLKDNYMFNQQQKKTDCELIKLLEKED